MRLVDANVLLHAINADSRHHAASREWLVGALGGRDVVGLPWVSLLAFLRLATKPAIFPHPLSSREAIEQAREWISAPAAVLVHPDAGHAVTLFRMLDDVGVAGNLVTDAHLAALAVARRADIVSYDTDFDRFRQIRRVEPEDLLAS